MLMQDAETRRVLWNRMVEAIETYLTGIGDARVAPALDSSAIREALAPFDFEHPVDPVEGKRRDPARRCAKRGPQWLKSILFSAVMRSRRS